MRVSVAMTTYKSTKYMREQLESIFCQTRLPDELIICDDASPDDTYEQLQEIIKLAPDTIEIKLFRNPYNIGFVKNFEAAFSRCTGEIIFPSDADDYWENEKIDLLSAALEKNPSAVYAFCDATVINSEGEVILNSLCSTWDIRDNKQNGTEVSILVAKRKGCPHGMVSCFRRSLLMHSVPFQKNIGHDEWLSLIASCYGDVIYVDEKLVQYRRHNCNTSGNKPSIWKRLNTWSRESWFTHAEDIRDAFTFFLRKYGDLAQPELLQVVNKQIRFQTVLVDIIERKPFGGLRLLREYLSGRYTEFRGTWKTLVFDELYLFLHIIK